MTLTPAATFQALLRQADYRSGLSAIRGCAQNRQAFEGVIDLAMLAVWSGRPDEVEPREALVELADAAGMSVNAMASWLAQSDPELIAGLAFERAIVTAGLQRFHAQDDTMGLDDSGLELLPSLVRDPMVQEVLTCASMLRTPAWFRVAPADGLEADVDLRPGGIGASAVVGPRPAPVAQWEVLLTSKEMSTLRAALGSRHDRMTPA